MPFEGKVRFLDYAKKQILIDAEPHIMQRLRKIFDSTSYYGDEGEYTHKPIVFPSTLMACRDIVWLFNRYQFDCETETIELIQSRANEYDEILSSVTDADKDPVYKTSGQALKLAVELRDHQIKFNNMAKKLKRLLLADLLGLGKTISAISTLAEPEMRPAIIVVPTHLCTQWDQQLKRVFPDCTTHIIKGFSTHPLPLVDVILTSYNRIQPWQDELLSNNYEFNTVIFDEVHELRHTNTGKRQTAIALSKRAKQVFGLSATPIFNMGREIWSVLDVIKPDSLGDQSDFEWEWCGGTSSGGKVQEPAILNQFLKKQGLMLRRTYLEAGFKPHEANKQVIQLETDFERLNKENDITKMLAMSVLSLKVGEENISAREFDLKLRKATGIAKAHPAAQFIKMLLDGGETDEQVLVGVWHREVHDVIMRELSAYNPVQYSGSETPDQKEKNKQAFLDKKSRVLLISLGSGAGLDGLQYAEKCKNLVAVEIPWSGRILDQLIGRLARDGQTKPVQAYLLTIPDGSDPFIMGLIGEKQSQYDGLIEGKEAEAELLASNSPSLDRIKEMATNYLKALGEEIPEPVVETGLTAEVATLLRRLKIPTNTELEMQEAVYKALIQHLDPSITVEREFQLSKRSRLDFLISRDSERVVIECKINAARRTDVYKQVRRYVEEGQATSVILLAPWNGVASFFVETTLDTTLKTTPVVVIDTTLTAL